MSCIPESTESSVAVLRGVWAGSCEGERSGEGDNEYREGDGETDKRVRGGALRVLLEGRTELIKKLSERVSLAVKRLSAWNTNIFY